MIIKQSNELYCSEGKLFIFTGGLKRSDFDGKDIGEEREGGHDMYLYQPPKDYDSAIHELDGVVKPIPGTPYCAEGFRDLTPAEIDTALQAKVDDARNVVLNKRKAGYVETDSLRNHLEGDGDPDWLETWQTARLKVKADSPFQS